MEYSQDLYAAHSEYLTDSQTRYNLAFPETMVDVLAAQKKAYALQQLDRLMADLSAYKLTDIAVVATALRHTKAEFSWWWVQAMWHGDAEALADFKTLGRYQSRFADLTIDVALKALLRTPEFERLVPASALMPTGHLAGFFILGLGKLGGYDLNFSSDVDIIAFYDKALLPASLQRSGMHELSQLLQRLTRLLSDKIDGEFVWRVDWRLRPNASATFLTQSTDYAETFYFFHAQPWHRLALIKARCIAGDKATGEQFLQTIYPFLWRKNLDFRALDEIHQLKQHINLAHPNLREQRQQSQATNLEEIVGINVKLGHGGIREIEFMVNALQLIWGGKKPILQTTNTLENLQHLADEGLLPVPLAADLCRAYQWLRTVENGLQILANQQAYHVPSDALSQRRLLAVVSPVLNPVLNKDATDYTWDVFSAQARQHRAVVSEAFTKFFAHNEDEEGSDKPEEKTDATHKKSHKPTDVSADTIDKSTLNERSRQILDFWLEGFCVYGISRSQAHQFGALAERLLAQIVQSGVDRDFAFDALHTYFKKLPIGGQYLYLLNTHPALLDRVVTPLLLSPTMANLLIQSPHIIEQFIEVGAGKTHTCSATNVNEEHVNEVNGNDEGFDAEVEFLYAINGYEAQLEQLRRLTNERLYAIYWAYVSQAINSEAMELALTDLAEKLLAVAYRLVSDEMQITDNPVAIIGLGKLGISAMGPQSDIDVVFIFDDKHNTQLANRFVSRFNTAINLRMREGRVYELDDRLRPYGSAGSATISVQSFDNYQNNWAKTWEHLALVSGRFVVGNPSVGEKFNTIRQQLLQRKRQAKPLIMDSFDMLQRVKTQRIQHADNIFAAKLIPGGLFELEFLINTLFLRHGTEHKNLVEQPFHQALVSLEKISGYSLREPLHFLRKLQVAVKMYGHEYHDLAALPTALKARLQQLFALNDFAELSQEIQKHSQMVSQNCADFYHVIAEKTNDDWALQPVRWDDA